jgi:putative FmdB family regulatory protein
MPLYTYTCCNAHRQTIFSRINSRDDVRQCEACGANLTRVFEAPAVHGDITPYQSPVDGKWIDSKAARRDDLKRNGCIEWEPGIRQDLPRRRQYADEKAFAPIAEGIEQTARELIACGKLDPL